MKGFGVHDACQASWQGSWQRLKPLQAVCRVGRVRPTFPHCSKSGCYFTGTISSGNSATMGRPLSMAVARSRAEILPAGSGSVNFTRNVP